MKAPKLVLAALAVTISLSAFSQQVDQKTQSEKKEAKVSTWGIYPAPATIQDSAALAAEAQAKASQQSFPAPNFGSYYIPVLGNYTASESGTDKQIVVTADEKNVGKVWIEGLAPVKVYALLKAVPGTYKIPAQKQAKEGTLIYDETSKQVDVCLGCGFKDSNPASVINNQGTVNSKKSKSVLNFTGVKTDQSTVSLQ